ncbi:MAG: DEAD/DEAH box helicase [Saprospiraceae bacterium]|nr:DEAD/DEAH box helicase [Saprospiraceae bacterium]MBP6566721.1 DEAD/DEAH box helicase [Saprospiraceae bacterium]
MDTNTISAISTALQAYKSNKELYETALKIYQDGNITCVWHGVHEDGFHIDRPDDEDIEVTMHFPEGQLNMPDAVDPVFVAILMWYYNEHKISTLPEMQGKIYTREGMMARVIAERKEKSDKSTYRIVPGKCYYGEHILYNEKNEKFAITLWNPAKYQGYIDNIDWKTNKLATTKHIIHLCDYMRNHPEKFNNLPKVSPYLELTLDPLHEYEFTWKYTGQISANQSEVLQEFFGENETHLKIAQLATKVARLRALEGMEGIIVRPEVYYKLSEYFDQLLITKMENDTPELDFSDIRVNLFPYQKEGVRFCLFKKAAIIADEMGLGKTLQAISVAMMKRKYFGFSKTLIICPSSVKYQWKVEILKFTGEEALVVEGFPSDRAVQYKGEDHFFFIANYETVMRDKTIIDEAGFSFIILDEAQKIKNYETKISSAITTLKKEHGLVLTGTPIENKLIDLYGVILFLDKYKVTPLWEFSYQHCIFDKQSKNKINGYYNLLNLRQTISDMVIRRQKKDVLSQLPSVIQKDVFILLSKPQGEIHARMGQRLSFLLGKKFKTPFDWDEIMMILTNMRRVSNSTYLIDKQSNHSSKLVELEVMLRDRLNILDGNKKIIIFSEWLDSLSLIEQLLISLKVGYVKLTGSVAAKKRGELIKAFQTKDDVQVFLSTEAGGSGLNLQFADTLINFEIPWNPAKKNQRIGRIDRIGQESKKLHVFNLICRDSIEIKIASGLILKQNLFDSVLNHDNNEDMVDFSNEGRAQFIKMLEEMFDLDENGMFKNMSHDDEEVIVADENTPEDIDIVSEESSDVSKTEEPSIKTSSPEFEKMEEVLTKGMEFLSGLFEMSTGQKLGGTDGHTIKVDKETGEVTLKFKMKF